MTQGQTVKDTIDGLRYQWFNGGLSDVDFLAQLRARMNEEYRRHYTLPTTEGC